MVTTTSRPTLKTVAEHSGVSLISVSRVMRNAPNISDALRSRVMTSATLLGYTPNRIAGSLRGRTSELVAVIVPSISNNVFANILDGIDAAFSDTPYRTVLGMSHYSLEDEEAILRDLLAWTPAGVIISGLEHSTATTDMLRALACPVVEVMDSDGDPIDTSVGISQREAGRLMADHFFARGYRRIGYAGAWGERPVRSRKRRVAFEERLRELGAPLHARRIEDEPSSFATGAAACARLLVDAPDLDAIFFANDDLALGAAFHCLAKGLAIPRDLAIAGFNGLDMRDGISPRLTTIRTPRAEIGFEAGKIVYDRIIAGTKGVPLGRIPLQLELLHGETT